MAGKCFLDAYFFPDFSLVIHKDEHNNYISVDFTAIKLLGLKMLSKLVILNMWQFWTLFEVLKWSWYLDHILIIN